MPSSMNKILDRGVSQEALANRDAPAYIDIGERSKLGREAGGLWDEPHYLKHLSASVGPPPGFEQEDDLGPPPGLDKDLPLTVPPYLPDDAWLNPFHMIESLPLAAKISSPPTWAPWTGMPCNWPGAPMFNAAGMSCQIQNYRNDPYDWQKGGHRGSYRSTPLILAQGLSELEDEDADSVIYVRGIHRLGFDSESMLRQHYEQYGRIKKVFFSNAHQKPAGSRNTRVRIRPSSIALILMSNAEEVSKALSAGDIQYINGVQINARKFVRKEGNGKSGNADCDFSDQHECRTSPCVSDVSDVSTAIMSTNSLNSNASTIGDADGTDSTSPSDGCSLADLERF